MSRLLAVVTEEVANLSGNGWHFYLGTLREQNIEADEIHSPAVFLRTPILAQHQQQANILLQSKYNLIFHFVEQGTPDQFSAEVQPAIDRSMNSVIEFLNRLRRRTDTRGVVFTDITNISTQMLFHEYDMDWHGVSLSVTLQLFEGFDVCLP